MAGKIKQITCLNCGGAITLRATGYTKSAACQYCGTVHELSKDNIEIASFGDKTYLINPLIPLGSRGKLHGVIWEVIGFMERIGTYPTEPQSPFIWHEYLLFNPYKGFRWLTEYKGHWNYILTLHDIPKNYPNITISYLHENFHYRETFESKVSFVLGEFYWRVKINDTSTIKEYIHKDRVLSVETIDKIANTSTSKSVNYRYPSFQGLQIGGFEAPIKPAKPIVKKETSPLQPEDSQNEEIWTLAEYIEPKDLEVAFQLETTLPRRQGTLTNQPLPGGKTLDTIWKTSLASGILVLVLGISFVTFSQKARLFEGTLTAKSVLLNPGTESTTYVTNSFHIHGKKLLNFEMTSNNLNNTWAEIDASLINDKTGETKHFTVGLEKYSGYDSDGYWTEGSNANDWDLSAMPEGEYHLVLTADSGSFEGVPLNMKLKEGVMSGSNFLFTLFLTLLPAVLVFVYYLLFYWVKASDDDEEGGSWWEYLDWDMND